MKTLSIILSAALLAPLAANAAFFSIDDTRPDETIFITANDFESGLSVNGLPFQVGLNSPSSGIFTEASPISFDGQWITPGFVANFNRTIYFVEGRQSTLVSDILEYSVIANGQSARIVGRFTSDVTGDLGPLPAGISPNDISFDEHWDFSQPFLTAIAFSDSSVEPVPEASTWMAGGVMAILVGARQLRRKLTPA